MNHYCITPLNGLELACIEFYAFMYEIILIIKKCNTGQMRAF